MSSPWQKFLRRRLLGEFTWKRLIRSMVLIYAIVCVYVFFKADGMIFLPPPASYSDTAEILKLDTESGHSISALYFPNPSADYTLLYSHGNAEDLGQIRPLLTQLHAHGFAVLSYDYSGYGTSSGRPSERQASRDIGAAYHYLTEQQHLSPDRIILHGRSVGGGPSTALAAQAPAAGLVLESTFTSAFRVVLPIPILPFDKFPNLARLPQVQMPVLVIHGQADRQIPLPHGERLFAAAPNPKRSLWVTGAGHNDLVDIAGERYFQALQDFAASVIAP